MGKTTGSLNKALANKKKTDAAKVVHANGRGGEPRDGKRMLGGHFAPEVVIAVRVLSAKQSCTVQSLMNEAVSMLLTKYKTEVPGFNS